MNNNILLVEADQKLRKVFTRALERAGFQMHVAERCYEAVPYLHVQIPDILIVDAPRNETAGLELVSFVRSHRQLDHVKIVIITDNHLIDHTPQAAMADVVLLKPVTYQELVMFTERLVFSQSVA